LEFARIVPENDCFLLYEDNELLIMSLSWSCGKDVKRRLKKEIYETDLAGYAVKKDTE
jgi:hypothetical protein